MSTGFSFEHITKAISENRTGVVLGGLFGLFTGGLFGLVFGGFIGFLIQRSLGAKVMGAVNPQKLFFEATFACMGRVAKADGQVTEQEISYARHVMDRMRLSEEKRREAMDLFSQGKSPDFEISSLLNPLSRIVRFRPDVKQMFVEIQLQAAMADNQVSQAELLVIQEICSLMQLRYADLEALLRRAQSEQSFHQSGFGGQQRDPAELLKNAYGVLGVEPSVADADLKRAYRRLMSQHHPDKLMSKGLPEEMMQLAKEKTQEIQAAYDSIQEHRKNS